MNTKFRLFVALFAMLFGFGFAPTVDAQEHQGVKVTITCDIPAHSMVWKIDPDKATDDTVDEWWVYTKTETGKARNQQAFLVERFEEVPILKKNGKQVPCTSNPRRPCTEQKLVEDWYETTFDTHYFPNEPFIWMYIPEGIRPTETIISGCGARWYFDSSDPFSWGIRRTLP